MELQKPTKMHNLEMSLIGYHRLAEGRNDVKCNSKFDERYPDRIISYFSSYFFQFSNVNLTGSCLKSLVISL